MIELGKKQVLTIKRVKTFGVYLGCEGEEQAVLLPSKYVPEGSQIGDEIEVFIYRDSQDRLVATTLEPKLKLGETAILEVKEVGKIGAFLDWGLEKDLFLPFKEQTWRPESGQSCLVALYIDKSRRLCATMKVYEYLRTDSDYQKNDYVEGIVYQINEHYGAFVAVDGTYHGMIPSKGVHGRMKVGDRVHARVVKVREDGKMELTMSETVSVQMDKDGLLSLTDAGMEIASRIYERHRLLTEWLTVLGVSPDVAAEDACRIEHDVSDETFQKIKEHIAGRILEE